MWMEPATGLRDRKKNQTHDAIRREAMRLILAGASIAAPEGDSSGMLDRTRRTLDFMETGMRFT